MSHIEPLLTKLVTDIDRVIADINLLKQGAVETRIKIEYLEKAKDSIDSALSKLHDDDSCKIKKSEKGLTLEQLVKWLFVIVSIVGVFLGVAK